MKTISVRSIVRLCAGLCCAVLLFTGVLFLMPESAQKVYAQTTYTYTYDGDSWDKAAESSYSKGDVLVFTTTKIVYQAAVCVELPTLTNECAKGNAFSYTVKADGATLQLVDYDTICATGAAKIHDKFKIAFNIGENATGTTPTIDGTYFVGNSITLPEVGDLANTGYVFKGWYYRWNGGLSSTPAEGGTSYTLSTANLDDSDTITFYAAWEEPSGYTVTYDDNVATQTITVPTDSNTYLENDEVTISTTIPQRLGYTFLGWNTDPHATSGLEFQDGKYTIGTENVTFYAVWAHSCHGILFNQVFNSSILVNGIVPGGNYYLEEDLILDASSGFEGIQFYISEGTTVNVCLNGHKLIFGNPMCWSIYGTLHIYDCDDTEHGWKVDETDGHWIEASSDATQTSKGGYISAIETGAKQPLIFLTGTASFGLHDVDIIGVSTTQSLIHKDSAATSNTEFTLDSGSCIMGNYCSSSIDALIYIGSSDNLTASPTTLNLNNVTIKYNVACSPFLIWDYQVTTNIGDQVLIKDNVSAYGEETSSGLVLRGVNRVDETFDNIVPLTVKEGIKGTSIDVAILVSDAQWLNHDAAITFGTSTDIHEIFTLATYDYNGCGTCAGTRYTIRNILSSDKKTNTTYISRYYTITYKNFETTNGFYTIGKSVGTTPIDNTQYYFGDTITIKGFDGLTYQNRYDNIHEWKTASYTFKNWAYNSSTLYSVNEQVLYNFVNAYNVADNIILYPNGHVNTLFYCDQDGLFHYGAPTTTAEVATCLDGKYTATKDADGKYTILTFNNVEYATEYVDAIYITCEYSENITITFKGTNILSSLGYTALHINASDGSIHLYIEGTLTINGELYLRNNTNLGESAIHNGIVNIITEEVENDLVGLYVYNLTLDDAEINLTNKAEGKSSFKIIGFNNLVVYGKQNSTDEFVPYGDFDEDEDNGYIHLSTRTLEEETLYYNYIKMVSYSVEEPAPSNQFEVKPSAESTYQWYEESTETYPLTYDSQKESFNFVDEVWAENITTDTLTFTPTEEYYVVFMIKSNYMFDTVIYKSKTDLYSDISTNEELADAYEMFSMLGCGLISQQYDEENKEYIYISKIAYISDMCCDCAVIVGLEDAEIYDVQFAMTTSEIENATKSTYTPTKSGKYMVKATASYGIYTSDFLIASGVHFDSNGGTGTMSDLFQFEGGTITLSSNAFEKIGYKFLGWSTSSGSKSAEYLNGAQYTFGTQDQTLYAIWQEKEAITLDTSTQTKTYNGSSQAYTYTNLLSDFTVEYFARETWTTEAPVNAGTYNVKITRSEDGSYQAYSKEIPGGLVIEPKTIVFTIVDVTSGVVYDGYSHHTYATYTELCGTDTLDYTLEYGNNEKAGTWKISIASAHIVDGLESNYTFDTSDTGTLVIERASYDMTGAKWNYTGAFTYNGAEQKVEVTGLPNGITIKEYANNVKTDAGIYTATVLFNNPDPSNYNDPVMQELTWEIKSTSITPKQEGENTSTKQNVIVESDTGFDSTITVTVEVTVEVEVETKELAIDYYNIVEEELKLESNEKVGVVFDVKLIQTVDGESREIQPSDIQPGSTIKVKMLIPDSVDISKVTRILHVHSAEDIEEIEFDASKVVDGYYEIEIDRLSEFAFIYEDGCIIHWLLIVLFVLLLAFVCVMWFVLHIKKFKDEKGKLNLLPVIGFAIHFVAFVALAIFSQCAVCIVFDILNFLALAALVILYLLDEKLLKARSH